MSITNFFSLLGGLGLFLYGMHMMSDGLENVAGNSMKKILEKLTSNRFIGVVVGALITAIIQSSSATTVMVVGFVNSGLMTLSQAVWIIMGANIGTTITAQIITLDIDAIAPIFAFIGVALITFVKNKKANHIGGIIAGFGILFIGMKMMSTAMAPLREYQPFINMISSFKNPFVGLGAGALFTAIIQSSSASVGILQALARSGVIGLDSAIYVLFGQNIGTCITAVIASIGTKRNAKRTTLIHLLFNVIGTIIFIIIAMNLPLVEFIQNISGNVVDKQIANTHTVFNVVTTVLLFPFGLQIVKLVEKLIPVHESENEELKTLYINTNELKGAPHFIELTQLNKEICRMYDMATENFTLATKGVIGASEKDLPEIEYNEKYINFLHKEVINFCKDVTIESEIPVSNDLFKVAGMIERIGDHLVNLTEFTTEINNAKLSLSNQGITELTILQEVLQQSLEALKQPQIDLDFVKENETMINELIISYRNNQIERLTRNEINAEACVVYSEILTDIERIGDHILSIAKLLTRQNLSLH